MVCAGKMEGGLRDRESRNVLSYSDVSVPPPQPVVWGARFLVLARDKRVGKVVFLFSYLTPESLMEKKELE